MAVDVARPPQGAPPATRLGWWGKLVAFYHGVVAEMRRVTWPDRTQVQQATIGIIIFVLVVAFFITLMDAALSLLLVTWIPKLFGRG